MAEYETIEDIIERYIQKRNETPDPIEFRMAIGIDPHLFKDNFPLERRGLAPMKPLTPEIKQMWDQKLNSLATSG